MKKLSLIILILLISQISNAESFFKAEWSEFCPKRYQNIDPNSPHFTSQGRYWAERRRIFEQRAAKCESLGEDLKSACYTELRELETTATESHNGEYRNKVLKYMLINSF